MQKLVFTWWENIRIDNYLSYNFWYSRNFFQHILERGGVKVNWEKIKKSYKLKQNDIIEVDNLERYSSPVIMEESAFVDLDIKIEKKDYLVLYKPKWVLSHPSSVWDLAKPSVVWFLYHKYKNLPSIWNFIRAWLIHRLDKDTDWFMIVAKTEKGLSYFKNLFQKKSLSERIEDKENVPLKKYYKAFSLSTKEGSCFLENIKTQLPYYIKEIVKTKWFYIKDYKEWITKILNFSSKEDNLFSLDLEILTWRTHQIRYHLSSKWLPIIGDCLYGNKESKKFWELWLTNCWLEFLDIEKQYIKIIE